MFSSHFQGQMVLTERQHTHNLFHDKAKCAAQEVKWNNFHKVIVNSLQLSSSEAKVNSPNFPCHWRSVVPLLSAQPSALEYNLEILLWLLWKWLSCLWLFATPWSVYTVHRILQATILEWVVVPFSRGSSLPRDWPQVSRIAGGFFNSWATREAQEYRSG